MVFIEKELKILHIDLMSVIATLEGLGAAKQYDKTLYDVYFDDSDGSYGNQKKNVRIRYTQQGDCLTLKHRLKAEDHKAAVEKEYDVDGTDATQTLIDEGLAPVWSKYKRRISYLYQDMLFDIDLYPGIPPLLEIEAETVQKIYQGIKLLGLQSKNTATCGARGLFRRYDRVIDRFPRI